MPHQKKYKQRRQYRRRLNMKAAKPKIKSFIPAAVVLIVLVVSVSLSWRWLDDFFKTSPYFNVSRIELLMRPVLKDALNIEFYNIRRGSNMFLLDIDKICRDTQKKHPEFKYVTVSRRLPNVISVRIEYKNPVAYLKAGSRLVPVSNDCIFLPPEVAAGRILPIISGVSLNEPRKLALGIKFVLLTRECWAIKGHRINILDLTNTREISMFLENGVEVRVGDGNSIKAKLAALKSIMDEPSFDFAKIKYIDLRFSDVVIGPRIN
jgi:cell division septal protein FtsQ